MLSGEATNWANCKAKKGDEQTQEEEQEEEGMEEEGEEERKEEKRKEKGEMMGWKLLTRGKKH